MKFRKCNMNPKNVRAADCVVRALTLADDDEDYHRVYKELFEIGYKKCRMPNEKIVYEKWLDNHGWIKEKMPKKPNNKRYTLEEWINDNPDMTFVASIANHLTFVQAGELIDTWNCSYKCIGNYWIKI